MDLNVYEPPFYHTADWLYYVVFNSEQPYVAATHTPRSGPRTEPGASRAPDTATNSITEDDGPWRKPFHKRIKEAQVDKSNLGSGRRNTINSTPPAGRVNLMETVPGKLLITLTATATNRDRARSLLELYHLLRRRVSPMASMLMNKNARGKNERETILETMSRQHTGRSHRNIQRRTIQMQRIRKHLSLATRKERRNAVFHLGRSRRATPRHTPDFRFSTLPNPR